MSELDERPLQRLDRLRASDVTGVYASSENAEGEDPHGALQITIDPTHRVVGCVVLKASAVRNPSELNSAAEAAYRSAVVEQLRQGAPSPAAASGGRPVPVASLARPVSRRDEMLRRHQTRIEMNRRGDRNVGRNGPVTGHSDNECVWVTLRPASSRGSIDADAGWLANAQAQRIGEAVTQAFTRAYDERDS